MVDTRRKNMRMAGELPDAELMASLLRYCPETGRLFWLKRSRDLFSSDGAWKTWNTRFSGKPALTAPCNAGKQYRHGHVLGVKLKAHRVVWAINHGKWPDAEIDHIDGNGFNNKIENLRDVSRAENCRNLSMSKRNTSGFVGVSWSKCRSKWQVQIWNNNKPISLGRFPCIWHAILARRAAELRLGYHENHGANR